MLIRFLSLLLAMLASLGCATQADTSPWRTLDGKPPIVIAHRGDSGSFPEHTLAGYQSAIDKGADLIEPDIVMTKDGVPICRHDLELGKTTDVAKRPAFADRGAGGYQAADFTLEEIKQLRAVQQVKGRDGSMDGRFAVPTLADLIELVYQHNKTHGTKVGLLIEIKAPAKHRQLGLDVTKASYDAVQKQAAQGRRVPVVFQCFDREACERLASWGVYRVDWLTSKAFSFDDLPKGIGGLGLGKSLIEIKDGRLALIDRAHSMGLRVHAWTFRDDGLPKGMDRRHPEREMLPYLQAGLDGVITDFPETGVAARRSIAEVEPIVEQVPPLSQRVRENSPRRYLRR